MRGSEGGAQMGIYNGIPQMTLLTGALSKPPNREAANEEEFLEGL